MGEVFGPWFHAHVEGTSKWITWYRSLAIIAFVALVILSVVGGFHEAEYAYSYFNPGPWFGKFLKYAGIGCGIAVVELISSMTICEFFDNVNIIREKIQELSKKDT